MEYQRYLQVSEIVKQKSFFLLGPRQTGKSTLLRKQLPQALYVDLLESEVFRKLSAYPENLRVMISSQTNYIVIDEIQKIPDLLNEVQLLLDRNKNLRFVLTGSSARKLKRNHVNLLGGRALFITLNPLVSAELPEPRILDRINRGGLPGFIDNEQFRRDMGAYVGIYLREEIQAEGLVRSIGTFGRVLDTAAHFNGQQINFTKIGNDSQVPPRTVRDYFQLFEDTLIGKILPAFRETKSRKTTATPKFYFFDLGVARVLQKQGIIELGGKSFGDALEHLIYLELKSFIDYQILDSKLSFWRQNQTQLEVDFVIDDKIAIEVKSTQNVSNNDLRGIKALSEEIVLKRKIVVCADNLPRKVDGIEIMNYETFLRALWRGEIIEV